MDAALAPGRGGYCLIAGLTLAMAAYRRSRGVRIWIANPDGGPVTWKYIVTGTCIRPTIACAYSCALALANGTRSPSPW
jgi:hypothetical protein